MPRRAKFNHPLREVRIALGKSQWQFARMFGVSTSYVQAIELGQRAVNDELCGDISMRIGVTGNSLKQKRGMPTALLQERTVALMPQGISEPILSELRKLRAQPRERLRYQLALWQKMFAEMDKSASREKIGEKLLIFLDAAAREQKHLVALSRLDRWIENQIASLNLRTTVKVIARSAKFDWQPFSKMPHVLPIQSLRRKRGDALRGG
jgi:transcriptional regulator with XRE-family HTH domain